MKLLIGDEKKIHSFHLPDKVDRPFTINFDYCVDGSYFSEVINLKANNEEWVIYAENRTELRQNNQVCQSIVLKENSFLAIKYADIPNYVPIYILPDFIPLYQYSLVNINEINIGSSIACQIYVPDFSSLICSIVRTSGEYYVIRKTNDQCYLNNYAFTSEKIKTGDIIFINGLEIIFMKNFVMVYPFLYQLTINSLVYLEENKNKTVPTITPVSDLEKNVKLYKENQLFVHSPRLKQEIEEIEYSFDLPPQKEVVQKTPMIFTFGSSAIMTMTSSISLFTSVRTFLKGDGDSFSLILEFIVFGFMLISGLFLPYLMELWEKKNTKKKEKLRQKKYKAYINKEEDILNQIVLKQTSILNNNNISLDKIQTNILNNCKDVWNRDIFDDDFLTIAIGYGNLPAKIHIEVPKKSFSLVEDNLVDLALNAANKKYYLQGVPIVMSLLKNNIVPIVIDSKYKE